MWLLALCGGCFRTSAPPDFLPTVQQATREAYGGWIRVDDRNDRRIEGELLAATQDTLHVLSTSGWVAMPVDQVRVATLTAYDLSIRPIAAWGVVGMVSTISHGFFLILTAPIWIITSSAAAASASRAPRIRTAEPVRLASFARFPQGLPPDIDRKAIRSKYSVEP